MGNFSLVGTIVRRKQELLGKRGRLAGMNYRLSGASRREGNKSQGREFSRESKCMGFF